MVPEQAAGEGQASPNAASIVPASDIQDDESDHIELTFNDLTLEGLDQDSFKAELKAGMANAGVSRTTLDKMRIQLREGSVIASILGPTEGLAEIRASPLAQIEVMGCRAVVTRGAEPLVFCKTEEEEDGEEASEDLWYCLDNSVLQAPTKGVRKRLTKEEFDYHETATLTWGSMVRGVDTGDGWLRCSEDGLYVPMTMKGVPVVCRKGQKLNAADYEVNYFTDNSLLRAATRGLRHRASKEMTDYSTSSTPWGDIVRGIDFQDGWFKLAGKDIYLPTKVKGVPVLYPQVDSDEEYVVDNSSLKASSRGLRHRSSKNEEDYHPVAGSCWGTMVRGVDLGDGWFKVTATQSYLPMQVNGKVVLITKAAKEARRREALEAQRRAAFMLLPSVAAWLRPRLEEPPIPPPPFDQLPSVGTWLLPYPPPVETPRPKGSRGSTPLPSHRSGKLLTPLPSHRTPRGVAPLPSHGSAEAKAAVEVAAVDEDMPLVLAVPPGVQEPLETQGPAVEELEQDMVATLRPSELADEDKLPEEWDEVYDESMGKPYYYNRLSGITTWARPRPKGDEPELPPGWQEEADPETGMTYYFNVSSGVTTWNRPVAAAQAEESAVEGGGVGEEPLPEGWQEEVDPTTGAKYYYDRIHGSVSHERPTVEAEQALPEGWDAVVDPATGKTYYQNLELNVVQWDTPRIVKKLPEGWEVAFDPSNGKRYYMHLERSLTQWSTPRSEAQDSLPSGWEEVVDGNMGTTYYAHRLLGVSQWERPTAASTEEQRAP